MEYLKVSVLIVTIVNCICIYWYLTRNVTFSINLVNVYNIQINEMKLKSDLVSSRQVSVNEAEDILSSNQQIGVQLIDDPFGHDSEFNDDYYDQYIDNDRLIDNDQYINEQEIISSIEQNLGIVPQQEFPTTQPSTDTFLATDNNSLPNTANNIDNTSLTDKINNEDSTKILIYGSDPLALSVVTNIFNYHPQFAVWSDPSKVLPLVPAPTVITDRDTKTASSANPQTLSKVEDGSFISPKNNHDDSKRYRLFLKDLSLCNISSSSIPLFRELLINTPAEQMRFVQKHESCQIDNPNLEETEKCAKELNSTYQNEVVYTVIQDVSVPGSIKSLEKVSREWVILHVLRDPCNQLYNLNGLKVFSHDASIFRSVARNHCKKLVKDVQEGVEIYPKYVAIIYEDFVKDVQTNTKNLFNFINVNISSPVEEHLSNLVTEDSSFLNRNPRKSILTKQEELKWNTIVKEECAALYKLVNNNVYRPEQISLKINHGSVDSKILPSI